MITPSKFKLKDVQKFLRESNAIEEVYSVEAYEDAIRAWNYLKSKSFLTPEVILATHNLLMRNLRPDIAGFWRNCDVWIGGHKKKFVSVQLIEENVKTFCLSMIIAQQMASIVDLEKLAKDAHIKFEDLHPFEDGNGRVGRLIYLWHRMQLGLPIHIINADWPKKDGEQHNYYKWFKK